MNMKTNTNYYALALFLCGAASLATGCDNNTTKGGSVSAENFATQLAEASCEGGVECGLVIATEVAACKTKAKADAAKPTAYDVAAAVKAGRLTFDSTQAKACIAAAKNPPSCSISYQYFGAECQNIVKPAVAAGGTCQSDQECTTGKCGGSSASGCAGKCVTPVADGMECDDTTKFCGANSYCAYAPDAMDGDPGTCTAYKAPGATCASSNECDLSHWCRGTSSMPTVMQCRVPPGVGEPCETFFYGIFHNCAGASFCLVDNPETGTGTCKALVAAQGTCTDGSDCAPGATCTGLVFDQDTGAVTTPGKCLPFLAPGATCDPMQSYNNCPSEYPCDEASKTCKKPASGVGTDCSMNYCPSGLYCDNSLKCQTPVDFGGTCTALDTNVEGAEEPCKEGTCSGGKCALVCM